MLGMAMKAGKVASGEFSTEKSVKGGQAQLVIVSEDASDNTKKMFSNMCAFYEVPRCICGTKEELGTAVGKAMRASLAVTDENFARAISKRLEQAGKQIDNNANSHLERV
ncbi:50S ribosomal protein L7ae [Lachnospiraceae bacterium MD335]|jgi:ribosomal protein L7Ae-like RNA K-turn-binding protein|nr:50S ribosomal protein L7ae [Lachnospiraceae bacterium MD335]